MSETIVLRQGLPIALLAALRAVAPALVTVGMLYGIAMACHVDFDGQFVALAAIAAALALLLLQQPQEMGTQLVEGRIALVVRLIFRWSVLMFLLLLLGYATKSSEHFSRQVVFLWGFITPAALILFMLGLHEWMRQLTLSAPNSRRAVFAGCNEVSLSLAERLKSSPETRIACCGFFDDRGAERLGDINDAELLGKLPDLAPYAKRNGIDVIFVALPMRHLQRVIDLLDDLRDTTASIYYVPDIFVFDLIQARTGEIVGMPIVSMCETPFYGYRGVTKRLSDLTMALAALLLLSPLLAVISILVKVTSHGPVMFRQRRYGLDGDEITVYKFRTMTVVEDGPNVVQARKDDSRVTRVGRFLRRMSLDELPQLINVVQGRMSLVGPRPHAVAHNEEYRKLIKGYMIRHKVLPGMTGLAQVNGCRGETTRLEEMQARVKYDLEYLRRWTPMLDVEILWRTFLLLFRTDDKAY